MKEIKLLKGNEAVAYAAVRSGCDGYFGYPITPQSEILETLTELHPWNTTGMIVLQSESEVASINMVYGGAGCGKRVMTSSSSPGISLMSEGMSYLAGAELPCLVVNVQRGGPGLGTIQPSQSDYFQACKAPGHGDFHAIVLAPWSAQEMYDFVFDGFDLAFKYRNPALMLADGVIGQMMEKVDIDAQRPRWSQEYIEQNFNQWAAYGKSPDREKNIVTSVDLTPQVLEDRNKVLQAKYKRMRDEDVRYDAIECEDADYVLVAFGCSARICAAVVDLAREDGYKVGLLRPITLYPFPSEALSKLAKNGAKGFMSVELNVGQMVEDVRLAVGNELPTEFYGRCGGIVYTPGEVYEALKEKLINKTK
ncbi:MAG: 3-methyl-2-oxobutanoate dehydrogenase subunit VorB [Rikenellaceae bacterium]